MYVRLAHIIAFSFVVMSEVMFVSLSLVPSYKLTSASRTRTIAVQAIFYIIDVYFFPSELSAYTSSFPIVTSI